MNYVYDILLNFKEKFYDFYDWDYRDTLDHIRKIPLMKVSTDVIYDFLHYEIKINLEDLKQIENKTEIFLGRKIKSIPFAWLMTDTKKVIAVKIKGEKVLISDLLIEEEEIALELSPTLSPFEILYQKGEKQEKISHKTRREVEMLRILNKKIEKLKQIENLEKLRYIYYECFDKKGVEKEIMLKEIEERLENDFTFFSKKIDTLLKMTERTV